MAKPEKDPRLYFKVPNDFHRHPKVQRLSDSAFRTFIEMIGEARIADNDGEFLAEDAEFMWKPEVLAELATSHPTRPLIVREEGRYVNREYAKHQQTRNEREAAARVARENGAKGGRPRKPKVDPSETQGVSRGNQGGEPTEPRQTQAKPESESESESESELHDYLTTESVSLGSNRVREDSTDSEDDLAVKRLANEQGIDLEAVRASAGTLARTLSLSQAYHLARIITEKAKSAPKQPARYIQSVFTRSPLEVQQWIDTEVLL